MSHPQDRPLLISHTHRRSRYHACVPASSTQLAERISSGAVSGLRERRGTRRTRSTMKIALLTSMKAKTLQSFQQDMHAMASRCNECF